MVYQSPVVPPSNRARVQAEGVIAATALTLALSSLLWTLLLWYRYHPHLPWRDLHLILTTVTPVIESGLTIDSLTSWLDLHYGTHRIFVPRLLLALDMVFLSGQNHLFYGVGWVCMFTIIVIFAQQARWFFRGSPAQVYFFVALVTIFLFSPSHFWNLLNPVNISWHLTLAAAVTAFVILLNQNRKIGFTDWLLAILFAAISAFSTFAGVIPWLLFPFIALLVNPKHFIAVTCMSLLFVGLYCQGIYSDAAIISSWDWGQADAIEKVQSDARAALSANTPWRVLERTISYLGWPLSKHHPILADSLTALSLTVPVVYGLAIVRRKLARGQRYQVLVELCVVVATLCVAIALATHLGRMLTQPVHIHGPSEERFQTVVVVYWFCVAGLCMAASVNFTRRSRLLVMVASLALTLLLLLPGGDYLKEEVGSAESAARIYMEGERKNLRRPIDKKLVNFLPERIFLHDQFLGDRALAYRAPIRIPEAGKVESCDEQGVTFKLVATDRPRISAISVQFDTVLALSSREVLMVIREQVVGRLYPVHLGDYTAVSILGHDSNQMRGLLETQKMGNREALVLVKSLFGSRQLCTYKI